jgi:hypothetical protein
MAASATSSSSSGGAGGGFAVWLWDPNFVRVALVDVPVPTPPVVNYLGKYYAWSNIHWGYQQTTPYQPQPDLGAPQLSVLHQPQF